MTSPRPRVLLTVRPFPADAYVASYILPQNDDGPPSAESSPYIFGLWHYLTTELGMYHFATRSAVRSEVSIRLGCEGCHSQFLEIVDRCVLSWCYSEHLADDDVQAKRTRFTTPYKDATTIQNFQVCTSHGIHCREVNHWCRWCGRNIRDV